MATTGTAKDLSCSEGPVRSVPTDRPRGIDRLAVRESKQDADGFATYDEALRVLAEFERHAGAGRLEWLPDVARTYVSLVREATQAYTTAVRERLL
jgi:hypothetical protein